MPKLVFQILISVSLININKLNFVLGFDFEFAEMIL